MKVLVTGANGFLGSYVCREFLDHGYQVRAMHRAGSDISAIESLSVERVVGDIRDPQDVVSAVAGMDLVIHIAAVFRSAGHPDSYYHDVNVEGTRNVLEAAQASGVKKVIHCSTIGVHSHIAKPPANESCPYTPGDIYQRTKCEGEKLALEYFRSGKVAGSVIRPAMIWGPGDRRMLKLFRGISRRRLPLIGSGKNFTHWILVTDLARAFRLAAEKTPGKGEIYIIAGERPVALKQVIKQVAGEVGVTPLPIRIPAWPIQLLGSLVEAICIPLRIEPPIHRRRVDFFTKSRAFDTTRAKSELGFKPEHTFEEEVKLIANWYQQMGWLSVLCTVLPTI